MDRGLSYLQSSKTFFLNGSIIKFTMQKSLCFLYSFNLILIPVLFFKYLVSSSVRFMIAFLRVLVIHQTWAAIDILVCIGAFKTSKNVFSKKSYPPIRLDFSLIPPPPQLSLGYVSIKVFILNIVQKVIIRLGWWIITSKKQPTSS